MADSDVLVFFVNGSKMTVQNPDPESTLVSFLRTKLRLTGTKVGCEEGGCGACTVMLSLYDGGQVKHNAVNSCLTPLANVHGQAVTTIEAIGSVKSKIHPVQRAIAESHGSQCGYCTPGIIMSVYTLLRNCPHPTKQQLYQVLDGNLCRCTGYRPILQGLYPFTKNIVCCGKGENCCQANQTNVPSDAKSITQGKNEETFIDNPPSNYDPSQEIIFPPELKLISTTLQNQSLQFKSDRVLWHRPTSLQELLDLKAKFLESTIVAGNTEIGIAVKFRNKAYPVLISTQKIKELRQMSVTEGGLTVGSSVTFAEIGVQLIQLIQEMPAWKTKLFAAFLEMLKSFSGTQIRNVATLGGNILNASPISDINPLLLASRAQMTIASTAGQQSQFVMEENFFCGHNKTSLKQDEVLLSVMLPFTTNKEYIHSYKQANRREDAMAIANAGMYVCLSDQTIQDIRLVFGGMAATTIMAKKTMKALKGRIWDPSVVELACSKEMLPSDLQLSIDAPGGMIAFRRTVCLSFFYRFYNTVSLHCGQNNIQEYDVCRSLMPGDSEGSQFYAVSKSNNIKDTIGSPVVHRAAHLQCTGEAIYMSDVPVMDGELFLGLVTSSSSHAKILSVDPNQALSMPGVVAFLDHHDVPGMNEWGPMEQVFAVDKVIHEGQIIAAVAATSPALAQRAAKAVTVELEAMKPVVTIQDAIKAGAIHPQNFKLERGKPRSVFLNCPHVVEGEMHVNAQEHFYLECNGCVVYPSDAYEIEVLATTQSSTHMQTNLSKVLGISANRITVRVKRLGGGFGGKESRNVSVVLPTAIAAWKIGHPVRCVLNRHQDMCLTGTRHPAYMTYKVGFHPDGKITALDADLYLNMGCTLDLSPAVLEMALLTSDNAYNIKNFHVRGHLCQTNLTSCTAFRGFGGPQSIVMAETWISHVADFLQLPYEQVRQRNFYQPGDSIPCGQIMKNCNIQRCWDECINQCDFLQRQKDVDKFNRQHQWKKKGITVTPLKYGLAFLQKHMNQGAAHINIYSDGTALVFHGGVEMGQGLHTKMIQVVSKELDIPVSSVHIKETTTDVVPNTGPTAASMSSDLYGGALMDACKTLASRLAPYRHANPKASLKEWAKAAIEDSVSLSACGFYAIKDVYFDRNNKKNHPFSYFSFGAACSEVEIDCLTGDHQVFRTDIVMDVGHSLNPAIDVGQIEGAFMQGYGMYLLEDYNVSPHGVHISTGPSTYKIPSFGNIPQIFNVSLLKDSKNPRAIYSSKGVGEPPLCLATSIFMAMKKAVMAARLQNGLTGHIRLDSPATPDKIRMACGDYLASKISKDIKNDEDTERWSVKL